MRSPAKSWPIGIVLAGLALPFLPQVAGAQAIDEIDRLVASSSSPADGLALAQSQADAGNLLEALSTLERVLAAQPRTKQAKLLHAALLCRIDDQTGAAVEFARLKSSSFKKAEWDAARASCVSAPNPPQEDNQWRNRRRRPGT